MSYTHSVQYITNNPYWGNPDIHPTGLIIHSVGCAQPKASVFVKNFNQKGVSASVHGFIEPGTFIETAPCFKTPGVCKKCYHVGSGTKGSYNTTRIGIEMTEPSTIKYTTGANFIDLNPVATKKFIQDVTATAAEVFADLCIFHNISVQNIQSHGGAAIEGMGCSHVDPDHLWKLIGYDIHQFRYDVQKIIDEKTKPQEPIVYPPYDETIETMVKNGEMIYRTIDSIPDWAKPSIEKALNKNILKGLDTVVNGRKCLDLSEDLMRTFVYLDRLNLL